MIPEIGIVNVGIGNVDVVNVNHSSISSIVNIPKPQEWVLDPSVGVPPAPPVTVDIGSPVVNIPVSYTHLTLPTKRIV